jgi:hypothetical protein
MWKKFYPHQDYQYSFVEFYPPVNTTFSLWSSKEGYIDCRTVLACPEEKTTRVPEPYRKIQLA